MAKLHVPRSAREMATTTATTEEYPRGETGSVGPARFMKGRSARPGLRRVSRCGSLLARPIISLDRHVFYRENDFCHSERSKESRFQFVTYYITKEIPRCAANELIPVKAQIQPSKVERVIPTRSERARRVALHPRGRANRFIDAFYASRTAAYSGSRNDREKCMH